jgi:arylsulfatase A-like enzyme
MRILYLDLDTLRPDHLGCYGYHRNTSPNIDRIAAEGVRFNNYYCSDAPCLPSRAALLTGRFGIHTGVVNHGGTAADMRLVGADRSFQDTCARDNLPAFLRQAGFRTVSISPFGERHAAWWFYAGFNEMHNSGGCGGESAEEITPTALEWIREHAGEDNWFLHLNYWDPHTPYRAPAEFGNPFENEPLPGWITEAVLEKHLRAVGPHSARDISMWDDAPNPDFPRHVPAVLNMQDLHRHFDGYDCGIAYLDRHIGRLFAALEKEGVMDDLVIIISSDHGENQGELGIYAEHATADRITCRIPMLIRWPGRKQGIVDSGLHYNLDLGPTLAELLGREPRESWDGQSYAPVIREGKDSGREYLIISQCAHVCQRGVRWEEWLYIRTYHDGFHLFPEEMLFNVEADPHEQNDLAASRPDLCREGAYYLLNWHDRMMMTMPQGYDRDPLRTVIGEGGPLHARGRLKTYCERLKATGRGDAVQELMRRHPREFSSL